MHMTKWIFEPGHTAAEFRARHMMVTWVRGHFKNVQGSMEFDPDGDGPLAAYDRAFLLNVSSIVPEPACLSLLFAAGLTLCRHRRR